MTRIKVSVDIAASPKVVWRYVRDISSHVEWMADAARIDFVTAQREGVGTTFDCLTSIGPIRLVDRMEVVEWDEGRTIGIRHHKPVTGTGRIVVRRRGVRGGTRVTWEERLHFPWWLGGPPGEIVGKQILKRFWRRGLGNLKRHFEGG